MILAPVISKQLSRSIPYIVSEGLVNLLTIQTGKDLKEQVQNHVTTKFALQIKNHNKDLPAYRKGHTFDAGIDLYAEAYLDDISREICFIPEKSGLLINPSETLRIVTNVSLAISPGLTGDIRPRSSMSSKGLLVHYGTVDPGYRGRIMVNITNLSNESQAIEYGSRVAQLVPLIVAPIVIKEVDELPPPIDDRDEGGFGSTGG